MYQDSEDLLGKWFKQNPGKREHIFLATKFANAMKEDGSRYVDSSPEYTRKSRTSISTTATVWTR
jgi:aryl-alcohol dehydrogenase-like predicted oxidoreductase